MADLHQTPRRRTALLVPGDAEAQARGAGRLTADQVILDLAVVDTAGKDTARAALIGALNDTDYGERLVGVRVNPIDTVWAYRDVIDVVEQAGAFVDSIVVPQVAAPGDIEFVDTLLRMISERIDVGHTIAIEAELSDVSGLALRDEIALASGRLQALIVDPTAIAASLGAPDTEAPDGRWQPLLLDVLITARAADLAALIDPGIDDLDKHAYRAQLEAARALGYDGAWCTHPAQVDIANGVFGDT